MSAHPISRPAGGFSASSASGVARHPGKPAGAPSQPPQKAIQNDHWQSRIAHAPIPGVSTHAQARAAERYGRVLTEQEWFHIVADIIDRRAVLLARSPGDMSETYLVKCGTIPMRVVWRPLDAIISTVRPLQGNPESLVQRR